MIAIAATHSPDQACGRSGLPVPAAAVPGIAVLIFAALMVALDPTVFVGGGHDDWQYLQAATCVANEGWCIADNHWASRSPVVLPLGAVIAAFGTGKLALALTPAFYAVAALLLLVALVQRQFGWGEALVAGLVFTATPVIAQDFVHVGVNLPEVAFLLAALFCLQSRFRSGEGWWCLLAGLAAGLAILTRATSLVSLPMIAAILLLARADRRDRFAVAAGVGAILVAQAAADLLLTGDLAHHWRLQLGHTRIPSSELPGAAAASGSPLFNTAIIDGWRKASNIDLHWSVDGFLNLIAHPWIGLTLLLAIGLLVLDRKVMQVRQLLLRIAFFAAAWFALLVFALATDPKPRMFEPVVAAAAAIIGVLAVARARRGEWLAMACVAAILVRGLHSAYDTVPLDASVAAAGAELAQSPDLAVDRHSINFLALLPGADQFRVYPAENADRLLLLAPDNCTEGLRIARIDGWRIERERRFPRAEPRWLTAIRNRQLLLSPLDVPAMCIVKRPRGGAA